jgi:UDP-GlcNAc:undecaprenyl-phosphate/decaprenyl-phosphate GlcNAc-1-phosphate transferase
MFDHPDNDRKFHSEPTPMMGGIGIFLGLMIAMVVVAEMLAVDLNHYFRLCVVILLFVGMADDLVPISAKRKMLFMIVVATLILINTNAWITVFNGVFGIATIPMFVAIPLSLFVIVLIINAYNMIDGVDGLAATQGAMAAALFGAFFAANGNYELVLIAFSLTGALIGFQIHNRPPARIFMGDTGSLVVGFTLAFLAVQFVTVVGTNPTFAINAYAPVLVAAILIVPLFDILRVVILRKTTGRAAFTPSRDHVHHILMDYGFNARDTTVYLQLVQMMIILLAYMMAQMGMNINLILATTLIVAAVVLPLRPGNIAILSWMGLSVPQRTLRQPVVHNIRFMNPKRQPIPKHDLYLKKVDENRD